MQQYSTPRQGSRRLAALFVAATAVAVGACAGERMTTDPNLPGNPPANPQLRQAAFILDVNTATRTVRVTEPQVRVTPNFNLVGSVSSGRRPSGPMFSILAGDAVQLTTSNYAASTVGQFTPNKIRVSFDVNITNRLSGVQFITPTFPVPPAGTNGIILFPFETNVTVTSGGTSVGGDGTEVIVEQPNRGQVASSIGWDGDPFNFFNDTGCPAGSNDCYRYELFPQPLGAGATSPASSVGFDIDPTVATFRVRLIVSADLANSGPALTGTIAGSVTSPQLGALSGVTVSATPGTASGSTDGAGAYSLTGVATGPKTVALSGLPASCTNPGSQGTTVTNGGTSTVNFIVQCTNAGTVAGTISSSLGGGIAGVQVTVTPNGGAAEPTVSTSGAGVYSAPNVDIIGGAVGSGSILLANLPSGCTNPGPQSYSGLTNGGTATVDITVACTPPPQGYQFAAVWGPISGGQVTLTLQIDMSTFNNPAINGTNPDDIFSIQGQLLYPAALLDAVGCDRASNLPIGQGLRNVTANTSTDGSIQWLNFSTFTALQTGLQPVLECVFTVQGAATTATTTNTLSSASARVGPTSILANILINEGTLIIP